MNGIRLVILQLALIAAVWSDIFDNPLEQSIYGQIGEIAVILALIASIAEFLATLGRAVHQAVIDIGEATASFAVAVYKFVLRPLMRDYRAKEDNYKEIIRGLAKRAIGRNDNL